MGHIISTRSAHGMSSSKHCCEHHCCNRDYHRRRARKYKKKGEDGGEALEELLWAAGDLLKEYVRDVKQKKKDGMEASHRRQGVVERDNEDRRRVRGGYERYQLPEGLSTAYSF